MDHLSRARIARRANTCRLYILYVALSGIVAAQPMRAQSAAGSIQFNPQTKVFRIEGGDVSYVLGINEKKQVQSLYWGGRLNAEDSFATAISNAQASSFDLAINT